MSRARRYAVAVLLVLCTATGFAQVTDHEDIKTPSLRQFSMPQPKRVELPNGLVIFLQEDHELPLIQGGALIRGGGRDVQADKAGLAGIYGQAWRTGGTTRYTGDQLDDMLESRAARLETSAGADSASVSLDVLKNDFDYVFPLFVDLLQNPAFREDKIELAKTQANTAISRRNDEPGGILAREANRLGYGPRSPYAMQSEYATIASITKDDLLAFHRRTVHPNNVILSFIGDFDSKKLETRLRGTFGNWKRGPEVAKPDPAVQPAAAGVYFIPKDDVTQANIAMLHPSIDRTHPDYYAVVVMNEIFSGGFSGRLMQKLRSERGLTYGVGGGISAPWDYPGMFRVQMATKSSTTLEAIDALKSEVGRLVSEPVTAEELAQAKESILNAFVFTMDTREKALNQQVLLEFYGFPSDYYVKYPARIGAVTADDISRAAGAHIHPDRLAVLVVGKEADFEKPLNTLGTVTSIDITIPQPGGASAAPAAGNEAGIALAGEVAKAAGGREAIAAVRATRRIGVMTIATPQGSMEAQMDSIASYEPRAVRVIMKLPIGEMTRIITTDAAFMVTPMGTQDLPGSQRESAMADLRTDLLNVLKNIGSEGYTFAASGTEKVGDVDTRVLQISAGGTPVKWYVDGAGRVVRTVTASTGMPGDVISDLSDWKPFGSINLPTSTVVTQNGQKTAELKLNNIEINPEIPADAFVKK